MGEPGRNGSEPTAQWVNRVPLVGYSRLRIATPRVGSPLICVAVSPHWWGRWVHWTGASDLPCLEGQGSCPESLHSQPLAWKAWFAAMLSPGFNVMVLAQISYDAARCCPDLVGLSEGGRLRGTFIQLTRTEGKKTGRVRAELLDPRPLKWELPNPPDVREVLESIWWRDERYRAVQGEQFRKGSDDED